LSKRTKLLSQDHRLGTNVALSPDLVSSESANASQSGSSSISTLASSITQTPEEKSGFPLVAGNGHLRKLSPGAIAGIAVGSTFGFGLVVALVILVFRKRYKCQRYLDPTDNGSKKQSKGRIDPFTITGEYRVMPFTTSVRREKDSEKSREGEQIASEEIEPPINAALSNSLSPPEAVQQIETLREQFTPLQVPTDDNDQNGNVTTPDLLQLFENRVFENQLIQLISERMDCGSPPPISYRDCPDGGLPEYRSTRG